MPRLMRLFEYDAGLPTLVVRVMAASSIREAVVVLQISDTHLHATADSRMRGVTTYRTFRAVLEHARNDARWPPDAIVVTGDIVQDESQAGYERFRESFDPQGPRVYCIPGNHDDPTLMDLLLNSPPFQFCGTARLGNWSLILLNTFLIGEDAGGLGARRLHALGAALEEHADTHALVCLHHQPLPMGSEWLDGVGLRDADAFLEVIDAHDNVRGVLWGHVHQASDRMRGKVRYLSTPSTCSQFMPGSKYFALDERPPGMRWLELKADGGIATVLDWLEVK
jgi:3',5'-cyclic-AMP phosphodiesterase